METEAGDLQRIPHFFFTHKARKKGTLEPPKYLVDEDKKSDYHERRSNRGALQKSSLAPTSVELGQEEIPLGLSQV